MEVKKDIPQYKDINPYLHSLKTEFIKHQDFISQVKKNLLDPTLAFDTPTAVDASLNYREKEKVNNGAGYLNLLSDGRNESNAKNGSGDYHGTLPRLKSFTGFLQTIQQQGGGGGNDHSGSLMRSKTLEQRKTVSKKDGEERSKMNGILNVLATSGGREGSPLRAKKDQDKPSGVEIYVNSALEFQPIGIQINGKLDEIPKLQKVDYSREIEKSEAHLFSMNLNDDQSLMSFLSHVDLLVEMERSSKEEQKPTDCISQDMNIPQDLADILSIPLPSQGSNQSMVKIEITDDQENLFEHADSYLSVVVDTSSNLSLKKVKTVMNTWNGNGGKPINKRPSTLSDVMKETKEKYHLKNRMSVSNSLSSHSSRNFPGAEAGLHKQRMSIIGLPASPKQIMDPTVLFIEKQLDSWVALVKEMRKRTRSKIVEQKHKSKKGGFIDPVELVISLNQLGLSPNILHRVDLSVLKVVIAIKLWKKRALDTRSYRSLPIRRQIQTYEKQLVCALPVPIKFQIKEHAAKVLRISLKRYVTLLGPSHVKTIQAKMRILELGLSVVPDFSVEKNIGDVMIMKEGSMTRNNFLQCCYPLNARVEDVETRGGKVEKMKKVYPIKKSFEEGQNFEDGPPGLKYGIDVKNYNRIFPIEEDEV